MITERKLIAVIQNQAEKVKVRRQKGKGKSGKNKWCSISTGGQQEAHLVLRSPVRDVVHKNSAEPKVEMR